MGPATTYGAPVPRRGCVYFSDHLSGVVCAFNTTVASNGGTTEVIRADNPFAVAVHVVDRPNHQKQMPLSGVAEVSHDARSGVDRAHP